MRVTICGSILFIDQMTALKEMLGSAGHQAQTPPTTVNDGEGKMIPVLEFYQRRQVATTEDTWIWERKAEAIRWHFDKVAWADAVLIANYPKHGIDSYIGGNTLMEMGLAFYLHIPIILLHTVPDTPSREEVLGMQPIVLGDGDPQKLLDLLTKLPRTGALNE